ncbi:MAG TPA: winged helix-turn-helix domain-containing protein [Rhodanobacteraceae bacterium]|nr:winged helix-turn-helix domain-containing protein [Rhodanobacteraceae bacterium]
MTERSYRFGRFRVLAATRELRDGDAHVDLPARAFDCLVYLIEHRDRAVGRDELIAAVWGRADVSEALLNHTILRIRRVLGDGEAIRTVPRFGYRWAGAIESDEPPPAPETAMPVRSKLRRVIALAVLAIASIAIAFVLHRPATTPNVETAKLEPAPETALPALVLPAKVDAPDDWAWLRFGVMDLVANRLRNGALRTAPSESVVAMLKQRGASDGDALLDDASLGSIAALRILPRVRFEQGRWTVALDAAGMQRRFQVDAEGTDPIAAAREASNRLLAKLGHTAAGATDVSPALDDLMQRSGAAMLADQLDQARKLIADAPPELRDAPPLQQRMAQIELRAGEYDAVERRLLALVDRLDKDRDAALRARALITLASSYVRRDQFDKADEAYAEAIALRGKAKDPEVLGIAYLGRGIVLAQRSRFDEAVAELGRARIELETAGDPLGVAQVEVNLGDFQAMRHRPADALPLLKNAAQRFEQLGAREGRVYALTGIAAVERALLDPAAALATTDRFWPPESSTSNPRMQGTATRARIEALVANGKLGDAETLIERIRAASDPKRDAALRIQNEAIAARVAMLRGDAAGAARLAAQALTPALRDSDRALYTATQVLAAAALRGSDMAGAASAVARLRGWAAEAGDDWTKFEAALAAAAQAFADDRRDEGLRGFADAMQSAERLAVPDDLVAAGAAYADALIEIGHLDEARSVAGRIGTWADRDPRAAWTQVRLFRALGLADAEKGARVVAVKLAGEGKAPADLADTAATAR